MAVIGAVVRKELCFCVSRLAVGALMLLLEWKRRAPVALPDSPAERRKAVWSARRERFWMASVYVTTFVFILLITAQFIYARSLTNLSPANPLTFHNGVLSIPLADTEQGKLHRYAVNVNGTEVRFLLYRKPDGSVVSVYDACEICGAVGFYESANGLVCKNCAAPVNPQAVGQKGGCNPIPLKSSLANGVLQISQAELESGIGHFQH